jgi:serine kinase of HPr protein (carbohydrate metabolism regulator)
MEQIHATCIDVGGIGVLILGPSGAGKSDLALRLIDAGAVLVADDRVDLRRDGDGLVASPPDPIAGMLEVRGVGVVRMASRNSIRIGLAVDLAAPATIERIPESAFREYMGVPVPLLCLAPFEASAAAKLRLAVARLTGTVVPVP